MSLNVHELRNRFRVGGRERLAEELLSHLFWPTMIERADSTSQWLNWFYRIDSPLGASPSGHGSDPAGMAVIVVTLRIALYVGDWQLYGVAFVVIAARQHALFILYHDATHYHLTRHRTLNDFLINLAIGVPGMVPVEFYRPLHLEHHQQTGTANDPEWRFLYHRQPWDFRPLSGKLLLRQLLGDLFLINTLRNLRAYKAAGGASPKMTQPALVAGVIWLVLLSFIAWQTSAQTLLLMVFFWFVPLATLGTLLQKIHSIAEHSGGPDVTPRLAGMDICLESRVRRAVFHLALSHQSAPASSPQCQPSLACSPASGDGG